MNIGSTNEGDKYTVIKNEDIQKYFSEREKLILEAILYSLAKKRGEEGLTTDNKYIVVNMDEPYAEEVAEVVRKREQLETGDDQEFLMDEECVKVEFKGVWYKFTKLEDKDVSTEFGRLQGTIMLTHKIEGFEVPIYLLVDGEKGEFTFAQELENGELITVQEGELHDLAVDLVVYANENFIPESKPAEEVETEIKPAEQPEIKEEETPQPLDLKNGQRLLHKKGKPYKVKDTEVSHSEDADTPHVLYKPLYKTDRKSWVRPRWMFTTDRFAQISFWEYLQLKLGNTKTKEKLLSKKFNQ